MKIVVLDGYTLNPGDLSWDALRELGDLTVYERTPEDKLLEYAADVEILFSNKVPLRKDALDKLPSLKYIGVLATGYNVIDTEPAKQRGITVTNVPGYGTSSVVQLTFALLLELCQHVQRHSDAVMDGKWSRSPDFCFWDYPLTELAGKTLGIIGFGDIGGKVADVATAFGMQVIAYSPTKTDQSRRPNFQWAPLEELLVQSDVVSLHCPLTVQTQGIINAKALKQMKRSAFLINTSRGPLIQEDELAAVLNAGTIAGAALDVLSSEPPSLDNPLLTAKNCLITPHIAWATKEARARLMEIAADNLAAYLAGKAVNVVNK